VPFDSAGENTGVARAPAALRSAGLVEAVRRREYAIDDLGDVALGPSSPVRDPSSRVIAPDALTEMIERTSSAIRASLRRGRFPVVIGGDCPILLGCLAAATNDQTPGLLFVDGHEDAWPASMSTTGEAADMELGWLVGLTTAHLPKDLVRAIPLLSADRVVLVGPRDQGELTDAGVASVGEVVRIVRLADRTEPEGIVIDAIDQVGRDGAWWLHVDLDVLSTDSLAAVDFPQAGGADWDTLTRLTRAALAQPGVLGWDITIYNPGLDPTGRDAARIVKYVVDSLTA
jgi:arginase